MIRKENSLSTTVSMRIYKAIMKILHVIMYLRLSKIERVLKIPKHNNNIYNVKQRSIPSAYIIYYCLILNSK